jgi:hypothetical protein
MTGIKVKANYLDKNQIQKLSVFNIYFDKINNYYSLQKLKKKFKIILFANLFIILTPVVEKRKY